MMPVNNKREIKFRVWHPELKYWIYTDDLHLIYDVSAGGYRLVSNSIVNVVYYCFKSNETVIQQCTGLRDKNLIEIYEGDIVSYTIVNLYNQRFRIVKGVIEYNVSTAAFQLFTYWNDNTVDEIFNLSDWGNMEVIGNIYETPNKISDLV